MYNAPDSAAKDTGNVPERSERHPWEVRVDTGRMKDKSYGDKELTSQDLCVQGE